MKQCLSVLLILLSIYNAAYGQSSTDSKLVLKNKQDSLSYSIGVSMGESLLKTDIDVINQEIFFEALRQKINGEQTLWGMAKADSLLMQYILAKREIAAQSNKAKGEVFLSQNAKRAGVYSTPSGLQYEMLEMTEAQRPSLYSTVKCIYKGMTIDGKVFDQNLDKKNPLQVKVMDMIDGWVEGLQMMPVGSKWKLYVPSNLAYGERGVGRAIGANETLIFEIELLEIVSTITPENK